MANTQEKWQEIANRGLQDNFDPGTRARFDEAVNRGLITMPQQDSSFIDRAAGVAESAGTIISGAIAEPIAGISGLIAAAVPGGQTGAEAVESTRQALTIQPQADVLGGEASQRQLQSVGEFVQPAIDVFESAESGLGQAAIDLGFSPEVAAIAHTLPTAALEAMGLGLFKGATKVPGVVKAGADVVNVGADVIETAIEKIPQRTKAVLPREKRTQALIEQIQAKDASIKTIGKGVEARPKAQTLTGKFAEKLRVKGPDVVDMPLENEVVRQGYDKGVVADIKDASRETKAAMAEMLRMKERGLDQARYSASNPPSNVVGDALMKRVNVVVAANKAAGKRIGDIAKKELRGKDIDIQDASLSFDDSLQSVGVNIVKDGKGGYRADYEGSVLPKGDRGAINEVIRVLNIKGGGGRIIDAETVHDMKKILDNHISYGKTKDGLSFEAESILRGYRAGLDEALDGGFPNYDAANLQYAETITALDRIQDVAGKKFEMHSPTAINTMGREMRKILSNYGSRQRLVDAVDEIEEVASKYNGRLSKAPDGTLLIEGYGGGNKFKDDLLSLTLFDNELDGRFVPSARGGFENLVSRKVTRAAQAASPTGVADMAVQAGGKIAEKVRGVTDETAIKSMFDLLKSGN